MDKKDAIETLTALSHDTRLDVFRLLVQAGPDGLPAGAISDSLNVRQNTMSTNLAILERAGLVKKTRDGRSIRYQANYTCMKDLLLFLFEDCCNCKCANVSQFLNQAFSDRC